MGVTGFTFGEGYRTCKGNCLGLYETKELRDGYCSTCREEKKREAVETINMANEKALTLAAKGLLATMTANKREAVSPEVIDGMLSELGGARGFGQIVAAEIKKARGDVDPNNPGHYKPSQHITMKLLELGSRMFLVNDQREDNVNGLGALTETELANTLRTLAMDLIRENEEYRRLAAIEAIKCQPELINELKIIAGQCVEGSVVGRVPSSPKPKYNYQQESFVDDDETDE